MKLLAAKPRVGPRLVRLLRMLTAGAVVVSLLGFGGGVSWALDLFSHFRLQAAWGSLLLAAIAVAIRMRPSALVLTATGLVNLALVTAVYRAPEAPKVAPTVDVRLLSMNVFTANRQHQRVLDLIRREDPDVVVVTEVDTHWQHALRPLRKRYPNTVVHPEQSNFGIALYSKLPGPAAITTIGSPQGPVSVVATLQKDGARFRLIGTHPVPPINGTFATLRDRQLADLATTARAGLPVVLLGDLNATPYSPHFSGLLDAARLHDTRRGFGPHGTWPAGLPAPLRIPIDHALVSPGITVRDRRIGPHVGSDHLPVAVDIRVPRN